MNLAKLVISDKLNFDFALFGFCMVNSLAFLWNLEEPSKLHTFFAFNFVYFCGLYIIYRGYNKGYIRSISLWILVFLTKIIITYFIVKYFLYVPLAPLDLLRTSTQDPMLTDSNYYDYIGAEIVKNGIVNNIGLVFSTWLSFGVISYTVLVYYIFGISTLYVALVNCLLILGFTLFLTRSVQLLVMNPNDKYWQIVMFAMLLPYESYYDASPSKEPLTLLFMYSALYYLSYIYKNKVLKLTNPEVLGFFISSFLLLLIRANLGILMLLFGSMFFLKRISFVKFVISFSFLALLIFLVLEMTIGFDNFFTAYSDVQKLNEARERGIELVVVDSPLKSFMAETFSADSTFKTVFYLPIRFLIWILLPYPYLIPDFETIFLLPEILKSDWNTYFRTPEKVLRIFSTWIILYFLPFIVRPFFIKNFVNRNAWMYFLFFCVFLTVIISTNNFVNGGRYRTVVEPMFFVLGVIGMYKYNYNMKYRRIYYLVLCFPILFI